MALARVTAPVIDWQFPGLAKLVTEAETHNSIIVLIISPPFSACATADSPQ